MGWCSCMTCLLTSPGAFPLRWWSSGCLTSTWSFYFCDLSVLRVKAFGNCTRHLFKTCCPGFFFSYDHTYYSRYGAVNWSTLMTLSNAHPDAEAAFAAGEFSVQCRNKPFPQVAVDHAIEQTVNRHSNIAGGIIGIRTKMPTFQRWLLTAHDRASLTNHCHDLAGVGHRQSSGVRHEEAMPRHAQQDEDDVGKLMAAIHKLGESIHTWFAEHLQFVFGLSSYTWSWTWATCCTQQRSGSM